MGNREGRKKEREVGERKRSRNRDRERQRKKVINRTNKREKDK